VSTRYASPTRRLGLLHANGRTEKPTRGPYPYAAGDRIAGDLTVTGHLAEGRVGHLYQVWSASEWCSFTCKILAPEKRGERAPIAALRREAHILKSARHPNLVQCFGGGEHEGLPFILLEYLEGPSLFDLLEDSPRRRLEVSDAVRTSIHLGAAVHHLHRKGYLHLDLKPANLLLRDSIPVLIDLDTARRVAGRRPGSRMGTAPYMAPEQVTCGRLSPATDVYGLGALLYELLTGRWPFEDVYLGEDPRSGIERQYPQVAGRLPPPPSTFERAISPSLDRTLLRCLAPAPQDRFAGMQPILLALSSELGESDALWPINVHVEHGSEPRWNPPA
jgi:serine/threonine protein kinase